MLAYSPGSLHVNLAAESIKIAKQDFYREKFETTNSDPNKKWEFVNTVLNRKICHDDTCTPSCLKIDDQKITEKHETAEKFNEFFTEVGSNLAAKLPVSTIDPLIYVSETYHPLLFASRRFLKKLQRRFSQSHPPKKQ